MKTILSALLVSILCACGGGGDEPDASESPTVSPQPPLDCSGAYHQRSAACK